MVSHSPVKSTSSDRPFLPSLLTWHLQCAGTFLWHGYITEERGSGGHCGSKRAVPSRARVLKSNYLSSALHQLSRMNITSSRPFETDSSSLYCASRSCSYMGMIKRGSRSPSGNSSPNTERLNTRFSLIPLAHHRIEDVTSFWSW